MALGTIEGKLLTVGNNVGVRLGFVLRDGAALGTTEGKLVTVGDIVGLAVGFMLTDGTEDGVFSSLATGRSPNL